MIESPYSFSVPAAYLKFLVTERRQEFTQLKARFHLHQDPWMETLVQSVVGQISDYEKSIIDYATCALRFKSSKDKSNSDLRFAPINLHVNIFSTFGKNAKNETINSSYDLVMIRSYVFSVVSL